MWRYEVCNPETKTGLLLHNGIEMCSGYSGTGEGRNNSTLEWKPNLGPIPRGMYEIGKAFDHPHLGPCVMRLTPIGHNACNRTDLECHGNNAANDASHGCIIINHDNRLLMDASEDRQLEVF